MKYIAISIALYDYQSQNDEEISFNADDILYILDKDDPDWYKAQLKVQNEATTGPIGLIPANYIENAKPIGAVTALYTYASQSAEELSFAEDEEMTLYEKDDPDWFLVENTKGEFGLAPSNYVEEQFNAKTLHKITMTTAQAVATAVPLETQNQCNCEPKWAIALFAFQPEGQEETYLEENEQVLITDYVSSRDWWTIEHKDGKSGIVPANYVKFQDDYENELKNEEELEDKKKLETEAQVLKEKQRQETVLHEQKRKQEYEARDSQRQRELEERNRIKEQEEKEKGRQLEVERRRKMQEEAKQREIEAKKQASIAMSSPQLGSGSGSPRRHQIPAPLPPKNPVHENSSYDPYPSTPVYNDHNKPDPSKVRMWTDRTGAFKVEAQFLTCANGKIRLFKTNGVKIDVPTQKMCVEDLHYIQQETGLRLIDDKSDNIPLDQLNSNRFSWMEYFKRANLPQVACSQYARSFQNAGLGEHDLERLTFRQMKSLGMKERHVRRIQQFIETNRAEPPSDDDDKVKPKLKNKKSVTFGAVSYIEEKNDSYDDDDYEEGSVEWQINQDEILARQLQEQDQAHTSVNNGSLGLHRRGTGRPTPNHSAPRGVNSAALIPQQFSSQPLKPTTVSPTPMQPPPLPSPLTPMQQPLQPSPAISNNNATLLAPILQSKPGTTTSFDDDAWAPRPASSPSIQPKLPATTISNTPPPMPPRQRPIAATSHQQSLVDPQLLAKWDGSPAITTANSRPVPPPPVPSSSTNNIGINALQAQQQQQQAMFYQQQQTSSTGNSSFTSLTQQQQALPTGNSSFISLQQQSQLPIGHGKFGSLQQLPTNNSFTSIQQQGTHTFTRTIQQQPTGLATTASQQQSAFNHSPLLNQNTPSFTGSPTLFQQNQVLPAASATLVQPPPPIQQQQVSNFNSPQMTGGSRSWATATPDNPFGGAGVSASLSSTIAPTTSSALMPVYNSTGGTFQPVVQQSFQQQQSNFIPQQQFHTTTMMDSLDKYSVFKTLDASAPPTSVFNNSNNQQQQQSFYYK